MKVIRLKLIYNWMILGWSSTPMNDLSLQSNISPIICIVRHIEHVDLFVLYAWQSPWWVQCCNEATIWSDKSFIGIFDCPKKFYRLSIYIFTVFVYITTHALPKRMDAEAQRSYVQTDTCNFTSSRKRGQDQQQANDKRIHHCRNLHCLAATYTFA